MAFQNMTEDYLFFEPRKNISKKLRFPDGEPEMSEFESAFLCGLIKKNMPKKIVEVGVAAGGTTAIILECLKQLNLNESTELHSVDINELFYRGNGEKTGFLAEYAKEKINAKFNHKYYFGHALPYSIEAIGSNIDFVILDTTHSLPGEILDFIVLFPYLSPKACIVLHDIANNHYGNYSVAFATQILLDSVTADKIIVQDDNREYKYPNIGAFITNDDTSKYIDDIFHSLMITWNYFPDSDELQEYTNCIKEKYGIRLYTLMNRILKIQLKTKEKQTPIQLTQNSTDKKKYTIYRIIKKIPLKLKQLFLNKQ